MKLKLTIILLASFLLTGCVDIFHAVSLHKGRAKITVRFTVDKSILNMAASFTGEEEPFDFSEIDSLSDEYFNDFQKISASINPINTDLLAGAELNFSGPASDMIDSLESAEFIPVRKGDIYEIAVPSLKEEESTDPMTASFLSGSRYTLLVDLTGDLRNIKSAGVRFPGSQNRSGNAADIMINKYGSSMMVEIPLSYLMESQEPVIVELRS